MWIFLRELRCNLVTIFSIALDGMIDYLLVLCDFLASGLMTSFGQTKVSKSLCTEGFFDNYASAPYIKVFF